MKNIERQEKNGWSFITVSNPELTGTTKAAYDWITATINELTADGWAVSSSAMTPTGAFVRGAIPGEAAVKAWGDRMVETCTGRD